MSKHRTPTPPLKSSPTTGTEEPRTATCKECGEEVGTGGEAVRHVHKHLEERSSRSRSENVRDSERPTSDTFRADAQVETAEAGDSSALHSSNLRPGEDDAKDKEALANSGASVFSPTGDTEKDGAVAKSDDGKPYDTAISRGGKDSPDWHREDVVKQSEVTAPTNAPMERNTEAVNALSNAAPYLLSRAENLYVAHCQSMEGEVRTHFNNLRPVERAAWLAAAKSTEP
jgi:hypothetical protein